MIMVWKCDYLKTEGEREWSTQISTNRQTTGIKKKWKKEEEKS